MRRILFSETDFNTLPNPPAGFKYIGFDGPNFTQKDDAGTATPTGGGAGLSNVSYSELTLLIGSQSLTPGTYYRITDFKTCYDQPNYDIYRNSITTGNYKVGNTHSIIVFATSENTLSADAWQPDYPNDTIKYDFAFSQTEVTSGTAYGRITERIDEWNNRTDYDHREVLFRRYRHYYYDIDILPGDIDIISSGTVSGYGTQFDVDFAVDDYLILPNTEEFVLRITAISSSQSMSVTGSYIPEEFEVPYYKGYRSYGANLDGYQQYYQNNVDGADDYLEFYTFDFEDETITNNKFGNHAIVWDDYTFLLPNNVFGEDLLNSTFGESFINNTFEHDVEEVRIGDYCQGNIYNSDAADIDSKWDFDDNVIGNHFIGNTILDRFTSNSIKNGFENNYIKGDFKNNSIGDDFQNNRTNNNFDDNKVGNYFQSNSINDDFVHNNIGNDFQYNNIYWEFNDNNIDKDFQNNTTYNSLYDNNIGNDFVFNTIGTFETKGDFQFKQNKIGFLCKGNLFKENVESNDFGDNLWQNEFLGYTFGNKIGAEFKGNDLYPDFFGNIIGNDCLNNTFGTESNNNTIGNEFRNNFISEYFRGNRIGNEFYFNQISYSFQNNVFGNQCVYNTISGDFRYNNISNGFSENNISYNFAYNVIGNSFYGNNIENDFGFGGDNARGNKIGNYFYDNNIGEYFYDNTVADLFFENTVSNYFQMNDVKSQNLNGVDFSTYNGNILTFASGFPGTLPVEATGITYSNVSGTYSYGGSTASIVVDATFDIYVVSTTSLSVILKDGGKYYKPYIGFTASEITISDSKFGGTGSNDLSIAITTVSDLPSVYAEHNTEIFKRAGGVNRLSYYDASDVLTITDIDK
jgi:hypothetical protein